MSDAWQQRALSPTSNQLAQFGSTNSSSLLTPGSPEPLAHAPAGSGSSRLAALGSQGGAATPPGTGGVTPPRTRPKGKVLMLTPGAANARGGDVSPGPSILGVVKRELELLEAKLFAELDQRAVHLQDAHERSDKIHDLAVQRMEKKLSDHDDAIARMDKRVAEVHGQVRGLNDSALQSSRWADSVDGKMEIFRNQVEEHFQRSASDLEAHSKDVLSKIKSAAAVSEESMAKLKDSLRRAEAGIQEQANNCEALAEALAGEQERIRDLEVVSTRGVVDLQDRLSALETSTKAAAFQFKKAEGSLDTRLVHLESQLQDQGQQVGRLQVTANGENGWDSRLHHHETVLTALQSKLQSFEEYTNRIDDAVRQRWGSQIDKLEKLAEENSAGVHDIDEKHQLLMHQSRARHDELTERLQELEHRSQGLRLLDMEGDEVVQDELPSGQITPVASIMSGVRGYEGPRAPPHGAAGLAGSSSYVESPGEPQDEDDGGLGARVGLLVDNLREMVPSVRSTQEMVKSHGETLGDLARRLQALEMSALAAAGGRLDAGSAAEQQARVAELVAQLQAAPARGAPAAEVAERLDRETLDRQEAVRELADSTRAAILEMEQRVRDEFGPKIQGVERSVKKVIEGNTNIVQTLTAHAGSSLPAVLHNELSPFAEDGGAELHKLQMQYDASEAKILDAQKKLRQRVSNFSHLLEAAHTKASSPGGGAC